MNTSSNGGSVEQTLYSDLTGTVGLTPAQAAGALGNAEVESGFDPTALNAREGAIGLFQWEGGRRAALDAYAAARGLAETDPAAQIGYLNTELAGPYAAVVNAIRGTSDPATAARLWDVGPGGVDSGTGFENSSGSTTTQRMTNAQAIYNQLAAGQPLTGGSGAQGLVAGSGARSFDVLPGGGKDPLNWPTEALGYVVNGAGQVAAAAGGSVAGGILKVALPFMTKAFFVVAGLGVVAMGLYRTSQPARQKIEEVAPSVAPLLAAG